MGTECRSSIAGPSTGLTCVGLNGGAKSGETSLLLAHATGFHARCWDQVLHDWISMLWRLSCEGTAEFE